MGSAVAGCTWGYNPGEHARQIGRSCCLCPPAKASCRERERAGAVRSYSCSTKKGLGHYLCSSRETSGAPSPWAPGRRFWELPLGHSTQRGPTWSLPGSTAQLLLPGASPFLLAQQASRTRGLSPSGEMRRGLVSKGCGRSLQHVGPCSSRRERPRFDSIFKRSCEEGTRALYQLAPARCFEQQSHEGKGARARQLHEGRQGARGGRWTCSSSGGKTRAARAPSLLHPAPLRRPRGKATHMLTGLSAAKATAESKCTLQARP